MKIIRLNETCYDEGVLGDLGIQFAIYHYTDDGYSGHGVCLSYKDTKWYIKDLGHCSCYGPFDSFNLKKPYDTLKRAIRGLGKDDWSNYFNVTIEQMYQEVRKYQEGTLFYNLEIGNN